MVEYSIFRFASAPRTATTWMLQAMAHLGYGERSHTKVHIPHDPCDTSFTISTVRHPVAWLRSYYAAGIGYVPEGPEVLNRFHKVRVDCWDFAQFVARYLRSDQLSIEAVFTGYHAQNYLRVEDLPYSLAELLGLSFVQSQSLNQLGHPNSSRELPRLDKRQIEQISRKEKLFCMRFEYHGY